MSHTIKSKMNLKHSDLEMIKKVGKKLNVRVEEVKNYKMYDGHVVSGIALNFKGWRYPAIITEKDEILTDTYNGAWGNMKDLETFNNHFMAETQKEYLDLLGVNYECNENTNTGEIELIIND